MKKVISTGIKSLFMLNPMESILRAVISKTGTDNFLIHLIPTNEMYSENTVRKSNINGLYYNLDLSSFNNWSIFWKISSEQRPKNILYNLIKQNDVIIDVGAHIGEVSMNMAQRTTGGMVYSIEGYPPTYKKLTEHIAINNFKNIIPVLSGVGESKYNAEFSVNARNAGGNMIAKNSGNSNAGIEINTLDNILAQFDLEKIDLIKMDIEGYEVNALKGAKEIIATYKPALFVEMSDQTLRKQGTSAADLFHTMKDLGYSSFLDVRTSANLDENSTFEGIHTDILASF